MLKRGSDALELSTHTRRSHFVYSVLEYTLVIAITLFAIIATSTIFIDEFAKIVNKAETMPDISSSLID